jgi:hypothetical protein
MRALPTLPDCVRAANRHRLFEQHVLAGLQGLNRVFHVNKGRGAEVDRFDIVVAQHIPPVRVAAKGREVVLFARTAQVPLNAGEVSVKQRRVGVRDSN